MSLVDQKARAHLEGQGYKVAKVEYYNSFVKRKFDLFGFIDFLAIRQDLILGVQATDDSHFADRMKKVKEHENLEVVLASGIQVWIMGFKKGVKAPHRMERVYG